MMKFMPVKKKKFYLKGKFYEESKVWLSSSLLLSSLSHNAKNFFFREREGERERERTESYEHFVKF